MNKLCILFCDLDGVVNSETFYTKRANGKYDDKPYPLSEFDPEAVAQVNRVIEETGAKFVVATKVENTMLQSRIELFNKGTKFYLNKEMVVLVDSPILEITNVIVKGTMVYPDDEEMTVNDARYIQWDNGIHWYAKVGKFDVVDKDNNQKWNTKKEAQEATKWFIENFDNL